MGIKSDLNLSCSSLNLQKMERELNLVISLRIVLLFLISFFIFLTNGFSQDSLLIPLNIRKSIIIGTRSLGGKPGPNYWQNTANYNIEINFIPTTRLISGQEDIQYFNNSPDTLNRLWFKLYPNFYKKGSPRDMDINPEDLSDGVQIESAGINGRSVDPGRFIIKGTNMIMGIPPLFPHNSIKVMIKFSYTLNKSSQQRTGKVDNGSYFIAYFFPRIAVFDDIDGWNKIPYTGLQEFYNDFCRFNVKICVPKNYVVWATGNLVNPQEVLSPICFHRLVKAANDDEYHYIIDSTNLANHDYTSSHSVNTWKFIADKVTDFVFATSNHYLWKSTSLIVDSSTGRRTRVDVAFNPLHKDYYDVIQFARKTVWAMSFVFPRWPFPYSHETVFDGLDQMEYPMMVNDNPLSNLASTIELTDHEIFHAMFPFYLGTNETKYAWMDEGWATIGEWVITPLIDSAILDLYGMSAYDKFAGTEEDLPIITLSTQESGVDYYLNSYPKPALGYYYLRDILGDSLFTRALHYYIRHWHGMHPDPFDFFFSLNKGSGIDLDWFWKRWFFDSGYPEQKISKVIRNGNRYSVVIVSKGTKPVPVDLSVILSDHKSLHFHRNASCWKNNNKEVKITFFSPNLVQKVILGSSYDANISPRKVTFKFAK